MFTSRKKFQIFTDLYSTIFSEFFKQSYISTLITISSFKPIVKPWSSSPVQKGNTWISWIITLYLYFWKKTFHWFSKILKYFFQKIFLCRVHVLKTSFRKTNSNFFRIDYQDIYAPDKFFLQSMLGLENILQI